MWGNKWEKHPLYFLLSITNSRYSYDNGVQQIDENAVFEVPQLQTTQKTINLQPEFQYQEYNNTIFLNVNSISLSQQVSFMMP